jgi:Cu+-exporting ATPase
MSRALKIECTGGVAAEVSPVPAVRTTIPVTGMTCSACQIFVQRTLASQAGVQDAAVNLMLQNATVTFDPDAASVSALVDTI